jgi:hypothetical protein
VLLVIPQLNQSDEEMIEISKWVLKQANQYCKLNVQETTNAAIEDYVGTMYYFRINNDVDPMNTIEENIKDNVEGADFSCLYKSKNGEFKDMKLQFEQTGEESDSTYINMIFSNTKNEIYPYSEE